MSHLRETQRLSQTKHLQPVFIAMKNMQYRPGQIYTANGNKMTLLDQRNNPHYFNQTNKYIQSKEVASQKEQRGSQSRKSSFSTKQPDFSANSFFDNQLRSNQKGTSSVTSRKQKNTSLNEFESFSMQMVNSSRKPSKYEQLPQQITAQHFQPICPIGKGGFGKVWKVEMKKTRQMFAMKEMYKAKIIQKKSINSVMNERNLLAKIKHPFFINMNYAFQDRQHLYLIMDYVDGGDLRYHIGRRRRFTELQTKFFIANLIIGLEYLCQNHIIHRDIKPENLVLDSKGYIRITDLGVSRQYKEQNYQDTSGTPGYMAPQVMCRKNHSYAADYFAVGVMAYEFMLGKRPYLGSNRKEIRDQILSKQVVIKIQELPNRWSLDALSFINQLLQRNPNNRLGANGIHELKKHEWMKNVDFSRLQRKELKAPYVPMSIQQNYEDYKQQISQDTIDDNFQENRLMLRDEQVQCLFEGYQHDPNIKFQRKKSVPMTHN